MRFIGFCSLLLLAYCNRQYSSKSALKFNSEDQKSGIELLSDVDINENNEKSKKLEQKNELKNSIESGQHNSSNNNIIQNLTQNCITKDTLSYLTDYELSNKC